jgi:uncharacterized membrane protein YagU involved in acid resistance
MNRDELLHETLKGAVAGLIATVPMTATMLVVQRMLPRRQQQRLEPRRITDDILRRTGLKDDLSQERREQATIAAHFGYGAAVGAGYALAERLMPLPRGFRGPTYGMLVWAASYAGWLPAIGTLPPPQHRPGGRNALLIAAHLVWGLATEAVNEAMERDGWHAWKGVGDTRTIEGTTPRPSKT